MKLLFKFLPTVVGGWTVQDIPKIQTCVVFPCNTCKFYTRGNLLLTQEEFLININTTVLALDDRCHNWWGGSFGSITFNQTGETHCGYYSKDLGVIKKL